MKYFIAILISFSALSAYAQDAQLLEIPDVLLENHEKPQPFDIEVARNLIIQATHLIVDVECTELNIIQARAYEASLLQNIRSLRSANEAALHNKEVLNYVYSRLIRKINDANSCQQAAELTKRNIERLKNKN